MSVHYRLADRAAIPELTATVAAIASDLGLVMTRGKEVLELRPPIQVNKGTAAVEWATSVRALARGGVAIYIGDDRTDEDAFHALRVAAPEAAVTIRVGDPEVGETTSAEFALQAPDQVREFLDALLSVRTDQLRT
jgi:trehalose 6-phosphate phosphatase